MDIDLTGMLTHDRILTLTCRTILPKPEDIIITIPLPNDAPSCSFLERAGMVTLTMGTTVLPIEILNVNLTLTTFEKAKEKRRKRRVSNILLAFRRRMEEDPNLLRTTKKKTYPSAVD